MIIENPLWSSGYSLLQTVQRIIHRLPPAKALLPYSIRHLSSSGYSRPYKVAYGEYVFSVDWGFSVVTPLGLRYPEE